MLDDFVAGKMFVFLIGVFCVLLCFVQTVGIARMSSNNILRACTRTACVLTHWVVVFCRSWSEVHIVTVWSQSIIVSTNLV